jgi:hypothetical protein
MTLKQFIINHREKIDGVAKSPYKNDEERRQWVLNHEGLYLWARQEGVKI